MERDRLVPAAVLSALAAVLADVGEVARALELETVLRHQSDMVTAGCVFDHLIEPIAARRAQRPGAAVHAASAP